MKVRFDDINDRSAHRPRSGSLAPRGAEEVAIGDHTVGLRRQVLRFGCGRRPGPGGRRSRAAGYGRRRRDELLHDDPHAEERDPGEDHVDREQAAWHQLLALPGVAGRRNPETVSVTSRSLGCVMLTTRILSSWTGRSFGALSSRASRSTSWRISQDTAIS